MSIIFKTRRSCWVNVGSGRTFAKTHPPQNWHGFPMKFRHWSCAQRTQ
jgi:hypothetical protein